MLSVLGLCAWLAAADPLPPPPPQVFSNDTVLATVTGERVAEVSFVAAHCAALQRHLEFTLNLPPVPGPVARVELGDVPGLPPVETRVVGGAVLLFVRLGSPQEAPERAAQAAAQAWLARVALAGGRPVTGVEPWTRQALACEILTQLRPSLNDYWYREGRREIPSSLEEIVAGRAPDREALLFWRALRRTLGGPVDQAKGLIASAHGRPALERLAAVTKSPEEWWLLHRAELLLSREPVSLGLRESAESLDDITRFVFDLGAGDQLISGADLPKHRELAAVKLSVEARLKGLRREVLRQNPVYHNAWRTFGTWLEAFEKGKPEDLAKLWSQYQEERRLADSLRREVEAAMDMAVPAAK
ncbi:MAG: hypothetical protein RLZZ552_158 [Verrucomicrobiota bacterium]